MKKINEQNKQKIEQKQKQIFKIRKFYKKGDKA